MAKKFTIQINDPCHEDWNKMTPQDQGRHCDSCQKVVVDFTIKSDAFIAGHLKKHNNVCGRFKSEQLGRPIALAARRHSIFPPLAASFILPLAMLTASAAYGQEKVSNFKSNNEYVSLKIGSQQAAFFRNIKGVIKDSAGKPLAGVRIRVKQTNDQTQTGLNGAYRLSVQNGQTLQFNYLGFLSEEITVNEFQDIYDFVLEKDPYMLPEVIVVTEVEAMEAATLGRIEVVSVKTSCQVDETQILKGEVKELKEAAVIQAGEPILAAVNDVKAKLDSLGQQFFKPIKITGTVVDDLGEALPGVNVIKKGTSTGTTTDFNGHYSIEVKPGDILLYSYVGFEQAKIQAEKGRETIDVTMEPQDLLIGEIVVGLIAFTEKSHATDYRTAYNPSKNFNGNPKQQAQKETYAKTVEFKRLQKEVKRAARKARKKRK